MRIVLGKGSAKHLQLLLHLLVSAHACWQLACTSQLPLNHHTAFVIFHPLPVCPQLSSASCLAAKHLHHAAPLLLKHWKLCRLRQQQQQEESTIQQPQQPVRQRSHPVGDSSSTDGEPSGVGASKHGTPASGSSSSGSGIGSSSSSSRGSGSGSGSSSNSLGIGISNHCPPHLRQLLQRKESLLSLRAQRRAHAAADGLTKHSGKKHALTKLERKELRDVRLQLRALSDRWRLEQAMAGGQGVGAVTIGLCTLEDLDLEAEHQEAVAERDRHDRSGSAKGAPTREALAEALSALLPAEALVHECLLGAGVLSEIVR